MKYNVDFWCIDPVTNERSPVLIWPDIKAFAYPDGSRGWWIREDYTIECIFHGVLRRMTVKKGFDFDGASIPRWAWSIIGDPLALDIQIAALFHDILFCINDPAWSLRITNEFFLEVQQASKSCWVKRNTTTKAVQAAGWALWKKDEAYKAKYRPFLVIAEGTLHNPENVV